MPGWSEVRFSLECEKKDILKTLIKPPLSFFCYRRWCGWTSPVSNLHRFWRCAYVVSLVRYRRCHYTFIKLSNIRSYPCFPDRSLMALAPASPLVAPACVAYFLFCQPLLRWNLIFLYRPKVRCVLPNRTFFASG